MLTSVLPLFAAEGYPINAAAILPGLLRDFGDLPDVLTAIAPRKASVNACSKTSPSEWPERPL